MSVQQVLSTAVWASTLLLVAGVTRYDSSKRYIKYEVGSLNVIITAPHGGSLRPSSIPIREAGSYDSFYGWCNYRHNSGTPDNQHCGVRLLKDSYTSYIASHIADELQTLTGHRPHVIYNRLHRSRLDANREVNEATLNVQEAIHAYNNFTAFINSAKASIGGRALLLDIHGQTHPANWTELGYSISKTRLNSGSFSKQHSTIKAIGTLVCNTDNACFQELVRGTSPNSLGHYLSNEGYRVVPSPAFPSPGASGYYSGGYDVRTHGSRYSGVVDAVQVEIPRQERFSSVRRPKIAKALARAVKYFMDDHY